jgi:riboflavin synthase
MFTGLVAELGQVTSVETLDDGARLTIRTGLAGELGAGDSVAVNGVCLTAITHGLESFAADVVPETLRRSTLGDLAAGSPVNLELPLRATDRLGGHIVQGHVDGVATVAAADPEGDGRRVALTLPDGLLRYVVEKGSIALDGVSLTVAELLPDGLAVALIPETLARTTLGEAAPGRRINVEVDVLAKHVERLVQASTHTSAGGRLPS